MIRFSLLAASAAFAIAACASAPVIEEVAVDETAVVDTAPELTKFELGMQTVEGLVEAGNVQTAIDRLTQLAGDPSLSSEEMAEVLFRSGELRLGENGYDAQGAIANFEEIIDSYPETDWYAAAVPMLDTARGKVTSINGLLAQPETTRLQKFNLLMDLGEHQQAVDLMIAADLTPDNDTLRAMYHIGYLCEGEALTGKAYELQEADGTFHEVRFCDFGK